MSMIIGYKNYMMFRKTRPLHGAPVKAIVIQGGLRSFVAPEVLATKVEGTVGAMSREQRETHVKALREERLALRPKKGVNPAAAKYGLGKRK